MSNNYNLATTYGNLAAGNQPLSYFDVTNGQLAAMGTLMCVASGTNAINLSSVSGYPTMTSYGNLQKVGFTAASSSTSVVTIQYSALSTLNAYLNDGVTQIGTTALNGLTDGNYYEFAYNGSLNGSTGGWQQISANAGASGIAVVNVQTFTVSGTYTATGGLAYAIVEMVGGGGGGGGTISTYSAASSGGSGGYLKAFLTPAQIGSTQVITVGAGGMGGSASGGAGGAGSVTTVGTLLSCNGGGGGSSYVSSAAAAGGTGGTATVTTGSTILNIKGQAGGYAADAAAVLPNVGAGGSNPLGLGAPSIILLSTSLAGQAPTGYGSGGGGALNQDNATANVGAAGASGIVIITEFCT